MAQELDSKTRHVAGYQEIPVSWGVAKRSQDPAERTFSRVEVGDDRVSQPCVPVRIAYQNSISGGCLYRAREVNGQRFVGKETQRLIAAHAAAPSTDQHVPGSRHKRNDTIGDYGKILYGWSRRQMFAYDGDQNILSRICSTLCLSALMATGLWGANPDLPKHMTSVVRSDARTGKLVRSVVVSPRVVNQATIAPAIIASRTVNPALPSDTPVDAPTGISQLVERIAAEHSLPPSLIHAVIKTESNYNPTAISSKGALGLMQLMPSTARRFGVVHVFDPVENIQGGARYLKYLLQLYENNGPLALAAYNAGEAAVAKYNGIPPYPETQNYVVQVQKNFERMAAAEQAKAASEQATPIAPAAPAGPTHVKEVVDADGTVRYVSR